MNDVLIGKRKQKSVWLDEGAIAFITTYSRQHNINFSHAIESLALLGLQDTKAVGTAWLAFNVAGGSQKTLAARRQRVMLEMRAELQERVRILTRRVRMMRFRPNGLTFTAKLNLIRMILFFGTGMRQSDLCL
jgi:hypothetical protein